MTVLQTELIAIPMLIKKGKAPIAFWMCDEQWRSIRHVLTPSFSSKKLKMMVPFIEEGCEKFKNKMATICNTDDCVDVCILFKMCSLETILSTAFSLDIDLNSDKENPLITATVSLFQSLRRLVSNNSTGDKMLMLMSHLPWIKHALRFIARRATVARSWDFVEEVALKMTNDRIEAMKTVCSRRFATIDVEGKG